MALRNHVRGEGGRRARFRGSGRGRAPRVSHGGGRLDARRDLPVQIVEIIAFEEFLPCPHSSVREIFTFLLFPDRGRVVHVLEFRSIA